MKNRKGCIVMINAGTTKEKLDAILKAFEDYIDGQNYFDIVYSKKIGYVWIIVDEPGVAGAEQLDTPEAILDNLFNDIINDMVAPRESASLTEVHILTASEEAECRRKIVPILKKIEGSADEYLNYLDSYIKEYQKRYNGDEK